MSWKTCTSFAWAVAVLKRRCGRCICRKTAWSRSVRGFGGQLPRLARIGPHPDAWYNKTVACCSRGACSVGDFYCFRTLRATAVTSVQCHCRQFFRYVQTRSLRKKSCQFCLVAYRTSACNLRSFRGKLRWAFFAWSSSRYTHRGRVVYAVVQDNEQNRWSGWRAYQRAIVF